MELLWVIAMGLVLGTVARYVLPNRHYYGMVATSALGAALAAALWVACTWAGLKADGGVIWWITVGVTIIVCAAFPLVVGRLRHNSDEAKFQALMARR